MPGLFLVWSQRDGVAGLPCWRSVGEEYRLWLHTSSEWRVKRSRIGSQRNAEGCHKRWPSKQPEQLPGVVLEDLGSVRIAQALDALDQGLDIIHGSPCRR